MRQFFKMMKNHHSLFYRFFKCSFLKMSSADIGLIGLAVMGENLVLNMERNGFTVAVFNRTTQKVDDFINGRGKGLKVT